MKSPLTIRLFQTIEKSSNTDEGKRFLNLSRSFEMIDEKLPADLVLS